MRHTLKFSLVLASIYFIVGIMTLPHYGINWDSINHLPRGQAYLHYFLTGQRNYEDLPQWEVYWQNPDSLLIDTNIPKESVPKRSIYQSNTAPHSWYMLHDGSGHPPLSDILASVFNEIFFVRLRLINDIDAYRVYGIFLAASLVGLVYWWASNSYGLLAGLVAVLSLSLYPLFWSESHFNIEKDIPEAVFWAFLIFCFWKGIIQKDWKYILLSGIFFGLGLGTKFNVIFAPFVLLPWLLFYLATEYIEKKPNILEFVKENVRLIISIFFAPLIGLAIFIGTWPYLWTDPIGRIRAVVNFYERIGLSENLRPEYIGPFGMNKFPLEWILFTTPLVVLFFALLGFCAAILRFFKEKDKISLLFLLWFIVPIARVTLPGFNIYGGIRQIMEFIPALALVAGLGGYVFFNFIRIKTLFILKKLPKFRLLKQVSLFIVVLFYIPILIKIIQIHPHENAYFNPLIGGLKGAKEANIPAWGNTFGGAYRKAFSWLNKNAQKNAEIVFVYELTPNIPAIFVRPDLQLDNSFRSGYLMLGEYAVTLYQYGTVKRSYFDAFLENFVNPVYTSKVDGVPVVKVWKNEPMYLKTNLNILIDKNVTYETVKDAILFKLDTPRKLWRLEIQFNEFNCKPLTWGTVYISSDLKNWYRFPINFPKDWVVSVIGEQPQNGSFIHPFAGEEAKYIMLQLTPEDACLKNIENFRVYFLNN